MAGGTSVLHALQSLEKREKKKGGGGGKDYTFRRQFNEKPSSIPGCLFAIVTVLLSGTWGATRFCNGRGSPSGDFICMDQTIRLSQLIA